MTDRRPPPGGEESPPPSLGGLSATIERGLALTLFAGLLLGILATLRPFATAILFGSILAVTLWPLRRGLVARGLPPGGAAALLLVLVVVAVVAPLLAVAPGVVAAAEQGLEIARRALEAAPRDPPAWIPTLPLVGERAAGLWTEVAAARGDIARALAPYASQIQGLVVGLAAGLVDSAVQLLLALVVAGMLWTFGDTIAETLAHAARRLGGGTGARVLEAAGAAVRAVAYGVVGTSFLQAALMTFGLAVAGVPGAALLGFLTLLFSVSQILGPLVIVTWAGAAWWLWQQGEPGWSVFMAIWGAVLVSGSDNIVRPLLISRGTRMPLSLIILGVFGGFVSFGFLGLFIGPTLLAVGYVLLQAWRGREEASPGG
jgi:predicted PurR-regulated permease PerM